MDPKLYPKFGRLFVGGPQAWIAYKAAPPGEARRLLDKIVQDDTPFIATCVRQLKERGLSSPFASVVDLSDDDLLQAGRRGYCKALERFDPEKGALPKYAKDWIRNEVQRTAAKDATIHKPEQIRLPAAALRRAEAVEAKTGRTATAFEMGVTREALESWKAQPTVVSLHDLPPSDHAKPLAERVAVDQPNPEDCTGLLELGALVDTELTPKEREVIRLLYWEDMSLEEAADEMGLDVDSVTYFRDAALQSLHACIT